MVQGGMKCVKYLLFLFNLIFLLAGIALIAAGAYVQIKLDEYFAFFGNDYMGPGILLIVVGVIVFFVAFFGCLGAVKESYCLTMTFAAVLGFILILELAGGIAAFVFKNKLDTDLDTIMKDAEKNYKKPDHDGVTKAWDKLQQEYECCGVDNKYEWRSVTGTNPPKSCCEKPVIQCTYIQAYSKGCKQSLEHWAKDNFVIVGGVGIGVAFIQIVGIIMACCLARAIKTDGEVF